MAHIHRALVVEDDARMRRIVTKVLTGCGFIVRAAEDGVAALNAFRASREPPDLVCADIRMPKMDGKEFAKRLRQDGVDVPIVFVSGAIPKGQEGYREKSHVYLVSKPFSPARLAEIAGEMLAKPRPSVGPRTAAEPVKAAAELPAVQSGEQAPGYSPEDFPRRIESTRVFLARQKQVGPFPKPQARTAASPPPAAQPPPEQPDAVNLERRLQESDRPEQRRPGQWLPRLIAWPGGFRPEAVRLWGEVFGQALAAFMEARGLVCCAFEPIAAFGAPEGRRWYCLPEVKVGPELFQEAVARRLRAALLLGPAAPGPERLEALLAAEYLDRASLLPADAAVAELDGFRRVLEISFLRDEGVFLRTLGGEAARLGCTLRRGKWAPS